MELEEQPYSIVELLTPPNGYVSGFEGIHIFNNSLLWSVAERVVDNRNDLYRESYLLSRELLFVQVEPDAPIGIVDKMEKSQECNPVQLNYLELALPRKICL